MKILPSLFIFLLFISAISTSSYWEFPTSNNNPPIWNQQRTSRAQQLITLGRYSERDGDRDMLEGRQNGLMRTAAVGTWGNGQMATVAAPSIWGFAPNYDGTVARIQREWTAVENGKTITMNAVEGQHPLLDKQIRPSSSSQPDSPISPSLPSAQVPITVNSPFSLGIHAIDRFETNLGRFASGPPPGTNRNRILLPPNFLERISAGTKSDPKNMSAIGGIEQERVASIEGKNEPPKTRILTNDQIPPSLNGIRPTPIVPLNNNKNNKFENGWKKTTFSSSAEEPLKLPDFRHEDIRPEIDGERLGPQGKFGGASNQYKEDWGKELTAKGRGEEIGTTAMEYGPKWISTGDGPASKLVGTGINAPLEGTKMIIGERKSNISGNENVQLVQNGGMMKEYLNAPEELTGSRWRNIDEYFNNLNGGNRGRGPNRYVKMDLSNE